MTFPTHIYAHSTVIGESAQRTHTRKARQNGASSMARDGIVAKQTRVGCGGDGASTADTRIFSPQTFPLKLVRTYTE
jgi:hypothetical protein